MGLPNQFRHNLVVLIVFSCCLSSAHGQADWNTIAEILGGSDSQKKPAEELKNNEPTILNKTAEMQNLAEILSGSRDVEGFLKAVSRLKAADLREKLLQRWVEIERDRIACKVLEDAVRFSLLRRNDLSEKLVNASDQVPSDELHALAARQYAAKTLMMLAEFSRVLAYLQSEALAVACNPPPKQGKGQTADQFDAKRESFVQLPYRQLKDMYSRSWDDHRSGKESPELFQEWLWTQMISGVLKIEEPKVISHGDPSEAISKIITTSGHILTQPGFGSVSDVVSGADKVVAGLKPRVAAVREAGDWFLQRQNGGQRASWLKNPNRERPAKVNKELVKFLCSIVPPPGSKKPGLAREVEILVEKRLSVLLTQENKLHAWLEANADIYEAKSLFASLVEGRGTWKLSGIDFDELVENANQNSGYERVKTLVNAIAPMLTSTHNDADPSSIYDRVKDQLAQQIHEQVVIGEFVKESKSLSTSIKRLRLPEESGGVPILDSAYRNLIQRKNDLHQIIGSDFKAGQPLTEANLANILARVEAWRVDFMRLRLPNSPREWLSSELLKSGTKYSLTHGSKLEGIILEVTEAKIDEPKAVGGESTIHLRARVELSIPMKDANAARLIIPLMPTGGAKDTLPPVLELPPIQLQVNDLSTTDLSAALAKRTDAVLGRINSYINTHFGDFQQKLAKLEAFKQLMQNDHLVESIRLNRDEMLLLPPDIIGAADPAKPLKVSFADGFDRLAVSDFLTEVAQAQLNAEVAQLFDKLTDGGSAMLTQLLTRAKEHTESTLLSQCELRDGTLQVSLSDVLHQLEIDESIEGTVEFGEDRTGVTGNDDWKQDLAVLLLKRSANIVAEENLILVQLFGMGRWEIRRPEEFSVFIKDQTLTLQWSVKEQRKVTFSGWSVETSDASIFSVGIPFDKQGRMGFQDSQLEVTHVTATGPGLFGPMSGTVEDDALADVNLIRTADKVGFFKQDGFGRVQTSLQPVATMIGLQLSAVPPNRIEVYKDGHIEVQGQRISTPDLKQAVIDSADKTAREDLVDFLILNFDEIQPNALDREHLDEVGRTWRTELGPITQVSVEANGEKLQAFLSQSNEAHVVALSVDRNDKLNIDATGLYELIVEEAKKTAIEFELVNDEGGVSITGNATDATIIGDTLHFRIRLQADTSGVVVPLVARCSVCRDNEAKNRDAKSLQLNVDVDLPSGREIHRKPLEAFLTTLDDIPGLELRENRYEDCVEVILKELAQSPMLKITGVRIQRDARGREQLKTRQQSDVRIIPGNGIRENLIRLFEYVPENVECTLVGPDRLKVSAVAGQSQTNVVFYIILHNQGFQFTPAPHTLNDLVKVAAEEELKRARSRFGKPLQEIQADLEQRLEEVKGEIAAKFSNSIIAIENDRFFPSPRVPKGLEFDLVFRTKQTVGTDVRIAKTRVFIDADKAEFDFSEAAIEFDSDAAELESRQFGSLRDQKLADFVRVTGFELKQGDISELREGRVPVDEVQRVLGRLLTLTTTARVVLDVAEIPVVGAAIQEVLQETDDQRSGIEITVLCTASIVEGKSECTCEGSSGFGDGDLTNFVLARLFEKVANEVNRLTPDAREIADFGKIKFEASAEFRESAPNLRVLAAFTPLVKSADDIPDGLIPTMTSGVEIRSDRIRVIDPTITAPEIDVKALAKKVIEKVFGSVVTKILENLQADGTFELRKEETFHASNLDQYGMPLGLNFRLSFAGGNLPGLGDVPIPPIDIRVGRDGKFKVTSSPTIIIPLNADLPDGLWTITAGPAGINPRSITVTLSEELPGDVLTIGAIADAGVIGVAPEVLKVAGKLEITVGKTLAGKIEGRGVLFEFLPVGETGAIAVLTSEEKDKDPRASKVPEGAQLPFAYAYFDIGGVFGPIMRSKGDLFGGMYDDKPLVKGQQSVTVFGQTINAAKLQLSPELFSFQEKTNLFIAKLDWGFSMKPSDITSAGLRANGGFGFERWQIGSADILVQLAHAKLTASVLGLSLRASTDSPNNLPKAVKDAILKLLDIFKILEQLWEFLSNIQLGTFRWSMAGSWNWNSSSGGGFGSSSGSSDGGGGGSGDPSSGDKDSYAQYDYMLESPNTDGEPGEWVPESLADPGGSVEKNTSGFRFVDARDDNKNIQSGLVDFQKTEAGRDVGVTLGILPEKVGNKSMFIKSGDIFVPNGVFVSHGQLAHIPIWAALNPTDSGEDRVVSFKKEYGINTLNAGELTPEHGQSFDPRFYAQLVKSKNAEDNWHLFVMLGSLDPRETKEHYKDYWGSIPLDTFGINKSVLDKVQRGDAGYAYLPKLLRALGASVGVRLTWAHVLSSETYPRPDDNIPQIGKGSDLFTENSGALKLVLGDGGAIPPLAEVNDVFAVALQYRDEFQTNVFVCGKVEIDGKSETRLVVVRMGDYDSFLTLSDARKKSTLLEFLNKLDDETTTEIDEPRFPAPMLFGGNASDEEGYGGLFPIVVEEGGGASGQDSSLADAKAGMRAAESRRIKGLLEKNQLALTQPQEGNDAGGFPPGGGSSPSYWKIHFGTNGPEGAPATRSIVGLWQRNNGWYPGKYFFDPFPNDFRKPEGGPWSPARIQYAEGKYIHAFMLGKKGGSGSTAAGTLYLRWPTGIAKQFAVEFPGADAKASFYERGSNWYAFANSRTFLEPRPDMEPGRVWPDGWAIKGARIGFTPLLDKAYEDGERKFPKLHFWSSRLHDKQTPVLDHPQIAFFFSLPQDQPKHTEGWRRHRSQRIMYMGENATTALPAIVRHRSVRGKGVDDSNDPANPEEAVKNGMNRMPLVREISKAPEGTLVVEGTSEKRLNESMVMGLYRDDSFSRVPIKLQAFGLDPITSSKQENGRHHWFYGKLGETYSGATKQLLGSVEFKRDGGWFAQRVDAFRVTQNGDDIVGCAVTYANPALEKRELVLLTTQDNATAQVNKVSVKDASRLTEQKKHIGPVVRYLLGQNQTNKTWEFFKRSRFGAAQVGDEDSPSVQNNEDMREVTWFRSRARTANGTGMVDPEIYGAVTLETGKVVVRRLGHLKLAEEELPNDKLQDLLNRIAFDAWLYDRVALAENEGDDGRTPLFTFLNVSEKAFSIAVAHPAKFEKEWGTELRWFKRDDPNESYSHLLEFGFSGKASFNWKDSFRQPEIASKLAAKYFADSVHDDLKKPCSLFPELRNEEITGLVLFEPVSQELSRLGSAEPLVSGISLFGKRALQQMFEVLAEGNTQFNGVTRQSKTGNRLTVAHVIIPRNDTVAGWAGHACWQDGPDTGQSEFWLSAGQESYSGFTGADGILSDNDIRLVNVLGAKKGKRHLGLPVSPGHVWIQADGGQLISLVDSDSQISLRLRKADDDRPELGKFETVSAYAQLFETLSANATVFADGKHELLNIDGVWAIQTELAGDPIRTHPLRAVYTVPDSLASEGLALNASDGKPIYWLIAACNDWPQGDQTKWHTMLTQLIRTHADSPVAPLLGYREAMEKAFLFSRKKSNSRLFSSETDTFTDRGQLPAPPDFKDVELSSLSLADAIDLYNEGGKSRFILPNHLLSIVESVEEEVQLPNGRWFDLADMGVADSFDANSWSGLFALSWIHENGESSEFPVVRLYWTKANEVRTVRIVGRFADRNTLQQLVQDSNWAASITSLPRGNILPLPIDNEDYYFVGVEPDESEISFYRRRRGAQQEEWEKVTEALSLVAPELTASEPNTAAERSSAGGTSAASPPAHEKLARRTKKIANVRLGQLLTKMLAKVAVPSTRIMSDQVWKDRSLLAHATETSDIIMKAAMEIAGVEAILTGSIGSEEGYSKDRFLCILDDNGVVSAIKLPELVYQTNDRRWHCADLVGPIDLLSISQCLVLWNQVDRNSELPVTLLRSPIGNEGVAEVDFYIAGSYLWPRITDANILGALTQPNQLAMKPIMGRDEPPSDETNGVVYVISEEGTLQYGDASPDFLLPAAMQKLKMACANESTEILFAKPTDGQKRIGSVYFLEETGSTNFYGIGADEKTAMVFKFERSTELKYTGRSIEDAATVSLAIRLLKAKETWQQNAAVPDDEQAVLWSIGPRAGSRILVARNNACWLVVDDDGGDDFFAILDNAVAALESGYPLQSLLAAAHKLSFSDKVRLSWKATEKHTNETRYIYEVFPDQRSELLRQQENAPFDTLRSNPSDDQLHLVILESNGEWNPVYILQHPLVGADKSKETALHQNEEFFASLDVRQMPLAVRTLKTLGQPPAVVFDDNRIHLSDEDGNWASAAHAHQTVFLGNTTANRLLQDGLSHPSVRIAVRLANRMDFREKEEVSWLEWQVGADKRYILVTRTDKAVRTSIWPEVAYPHGRFGRKWNDFVHELAINYVTNGRPHVHIKPDKSHLLVTAANGIDAAYYCDLEKGTPKLKKIDHAILAFKTEKKNGSRTTTRTGSLDWSALGDLAWNLQTIKDLAELSGGSLRLGHIYGVPTATVRSGKKCWWAYELDTRVVIGEKDIAAFERVLQTTNNNSERIDYSQLIWEYLAYVMDDSKNRNRLIPAGPNLYLDATNFDGVVSEGQLK